MERTIFLYALRDNLRVRRLFPWILLGLFCAMLAFLWDRLMPGSTSEQQYSAVTLILVYRILALASAIFTTAIISQEVEQRTIVYLLTRPVERWKLLLFRFGASVLVVFLVGVFAAVATSLGAYGGFDSNRLLMKDIPTIAIGALAYGGLFLFVSLLLNRAMLVCLLFAFGWETSVPNIQGQIYKLSIYSYLQALAEHPEQGFTRGVGAAAGTLSTNVISRDLANIVLAGIILVTVALSLWWFTHFEYVPREDAE